MSRDWPLRLSDIRECCQKILGYTAQLTREDLSADEMLLDAVVRNLEIIGEAAKHLPDHVRKSMGLIEWKKIIGMREWAAHKYFRLDYDIIWDVVESKIPALLDEVEKFVGPPQ